MNRYERLNGSEEFDLKRINLALRIGSASLLLTAYRGDRWGVSVYEDVEANSLNFGATGLNERYDEEVATQTFLERGAILHLGDVMTIGRRHGVRIILPNGSIDHERKKLYDWDAFETGLMNDPLVSWNHLELLSTGLCQVRLRDIRTRIPFFRTKGGTWYERRYSASDFHDAETDPHLGEYL